MLTCLRWVLFQQKHLILDRVSVKTDKKMVKKILLHHIFLNLSSIFNYVPAVVIKMIRPALNKHQKDLTTSLHVWTWGNYKYIMSVCNHEICVDLFNLALLLSGM